MNILAIDTITPVLAVTASGSAGEATISTRKNNSQHAEKLIEVIDIAIKMAEFPIEETNVVVFAEGPGSFTGLRMAYAAAKAIHLATGCTLLPASPLQCYAYTHSTWPGAVISVLDAKKKRFYAQIFRQNQPMTEPLDIEAGEVFSFIDKTEKMLVTGPDATLFAENLGITGKNLDMIIQPSGTDGISALMVQFAKSIQPVYTPNVPDHAGPIYVRKSDAETSTRTG